MKSTRKKGKEAEEIAVAFLRSKGYTIRHVNWIHDHKEIDIVAVDKGMLVVVEVKMRESAFFENPEDAISRQKIRYLLSAAEAYIDTYNLDMDTRFDVIAIINKGNGGKEIEHFEDAFLPPLM